MKTTKAEMDRFEENMLNPFEQQVLRELRMRHSQYASALHKQRGERALAQVTYEMGLGEHPLLRQVDAIQAARTQINLVLDGLEDQARQDASTIMKLQGELKATTGKVVPGSQGSWQETTAGADMEVTS